VSAELSAELRHALRTPLNHIIGYSEMLREDAGPAMEAAVRGLLADARELVKELQENGDAEGWQAVFLPVALRMEAGVEEISGKVTEGARGDVARIRAAVEALLRYAQDGSEAIPPVAEGTASQKDSEGTRGRLLVIDDSVENRDILRRHLERQGYGVSDAGDGKRGLEVMRARPFDVVLMDVMMPGMDGFEVLEQMKGDAALRDIPVVMISALDETNSVVRCIQMGAEDYLMKPFDAVLLNARIGASLEKKRLRDQLLVQENLASLGMLTAGIAHEIRNPLNFVVNFASAAKELVGELRGTMPADVPAAVGPLLGQLEKYVEKIDEHGKRADRIVRGMLMHSRGRSGDRENTDLKNLLIDTVNLAWHSRRAQDGGFNVSLEMNFDPETGSVQAVPQDIGRVFLNIVNNAFYEVGERKEREGSRFEPKVGIRTRSLGDSVEIVVCDNGPGIAPELMAKIFLPFFTTKPSGAGTGLGLSLSYDIVVRGHNGTIRAESDPRVETRFIVTLPRGYE